MKISSHWNRTNSIYPGKKQGKKNCCAKKESKRSLRPEKRIMYVTWQNFLFSYYIKSQGSIRRGQTEENANYRSCTSSQLEFLLKTVFYLSPCQFLAQRLQTQSTMPRAGELPDWRQQPEEWSVDCLNDTGGFLTERPQHLFSTVSPLWIKTTLKTDQTTDSSEHADRSKEAE